MESVTESTRFFGDPLLTLLRRILAGDALSPEAAAALVVEVLRLRATAAACAE